ncbi:MAG: sigma-E factor negative regulatory protein [Burkholderiales bacterium]|nr:sigma-E factor negative regulatory protein [Burkholderiales bacterium]
MKSSMTTSELLSALADDQLGEEEFAAALDACGHDESALDCWNTYHLIGDVLRSPAGQRAPTAVGAELEFVSRLSQRLAQEALITAPLGSGKTMPAAPLQAVVVRSHHRGPASNDGNFRWKLVAGVASLAAVSAIAWNASGLLAPASVPQLAQASSPQIVVTSTQGPVVRDARLEELLAAHGQFGTASALQESSGFLRNATFEMPRDAQAAGGR